MFSPDGRRIVYNFVFTIMIMNTDGSNPTKVDTGISFSIMPAWSPDGKKLAFIYKDTSETGVAVITLASGDVKRLTHDGCQGGSCIIPSNPSFSPDGKTIAFGGTNADIMEIGSDGTNLTDITNTPQIPEGGPKWSPDGKSIAFTSLATGHSEVYLMNPDGTDIRRLTYKPNDGSPEDVGGAGDPAWSPDSATIVFVMPVNYLSIGQYMYHKLYTIRADGTKTAEPLPNSPGTCSDPTWQTIQQ